MLQLDPGEMKYIAPGSDHHISPYFFACLKVRDWSLLLTAKLGENTFYKGSTINDLGGGAGGKFEHDFIFSAR